MNTIEQLKAIKPGKTYPSEVVVIEKNHQTIKFCLNSFYVGMYCAVYLNGNLALQTGDRNNKTFCLKLKRNLKAALTRGATLEIGSIRNCQLEVPA